jgi:hypothetical protein
VEDGLDLPLWRLLRRPGNSATCAQGEREVDSAVLQIVRSEMSKSPLECGRNGASRRVLDFHCRSSYKLSDGQLEWRPYFDHYRSDFPAAVCFSLARAQMNAKPSSVFRRSTSSLCQTEIEASERIMKIANQQIGSCALGDFHVESCPGYDTTATSAGMRRSRDLVDIRESTWDFPNLDMIQLIS